jgi:predicted nicotinamide N-methyase
LSRVGLVLWQSGYVLSDFLLLRLPQLQAGRHGCSSSSSSWAGSRVLELGCGAGTVGMFLALAGAQVRLVRSLPNARLLYIFA